MSGKLYAHPGDCRAFKALVTAQFAGKKLNLCPPPKQFDKNKFALSKVPAFESDDGKFLFESNAIAFYLANEQLRGKTVADQASVMQWTYWASNEIYHQACIWLNDSDRATVEKAKAEMKKHLKALDDYLLHHTYLVGERITLADVALASSLLNLYQKVLDPKLRQDFTNLNRWFTTLVNQPQFKAVVGDVVLCEVAAPFKEGKKTETKGEKKSQKQSEAKKQNKQDEDDFLDDMPVQPKPKDPFEKLPKGNFDMDDFKRFYSNNSEELSVPYFWEKFDKENYSIWFCEYLFPEELTLVFMSCNLISGMFQRLDKMRKHAFGSMILFGEDYKSTISGVWVWRGHDLAFLLSEDWQVDYESYSWFKLDTNNPDHRKKVDEYFKWAGDFDGKTFNQGKIFK